MLDHAQCCGGNPAQVRHLRSVPTDAPENPYAVQGTIRTGSGHAFETFPGSGVYIGVDYADAPPAPPVMVPTPEWIKVSWDPHANATVAELELVTEVPRIVGVLVRREFPGIDAFLAPRTYDRGREWLVEDTGSLVILDERGNGIAELAPGTWSAVEDVFEGDTVNA